MITESKCPECVLSFAKLGCRGRMSSGTSGSHRRHVKPSRIQSEPLTFNLAPTRPFISFHFRISSLASIDPRLSAALRAIREHTYSYVAGTTSLTPNLLSALSQELGHPAAWGDPALVPAYGGPKATASWRALGVTGRDGVGGIPCEIVHGKMRGLGAVGGSCTRNVGVRAAYAFVEALAVYTPVRLPSHPNIALEPSTHISNTQKPRSTSSPFS